MERGWWPEICYRFTTVRAVRSDMGWIGCLFHSKLFCASYHSILDVWRSPCTTCSHAMKGLALLYWHLQLCLHSFSFNKYYYFTLQTQKPLQATLENTWPDPIWAQSTLQIFIGCSIFQGDFTQLSDHLHRITCEKNPVRRLLLPMLLIPTTLKVLVFESVIVKAYWSLLNML